VKAEQFKKEKSFHMVMNSINTILATVIPNFEKLKARLWKTIDQEVQIQESDIYRFVPDYESDPFRPNL